MNNLIFKFNITPIKEFFNKNLNYYLALLFLGTCCFYIYAMRPWHPLYYFYIFCLIFIPFFFFKNGRIKITKLMLYSIVCVCYFAISFVYRENDNGPLLAMILSLTYFPIGCLFLKNLSLKQVVNVSNVMLIFSFFYLTNEAFLRLINVSTSTISSFYRYKFNSIMMPDTNFVGLITLVLASYSFYLCFKFKKNFLYKLLYVGFGILSFLSASRAVIIAYFLSSIIIVSYYFLRKQLYLFLKTNQITVYFIIFLLFVPVFLIYLSINVFNYLIVDCSFLSKLDLFKNTVKFFHNADIGTILIGCGTKLENIIFFLDLAAHNIITTYIVEFGLVGFSLIYFLWFLIIKATRFKALFIFIPIFIAGFSLTYLGLHVFYVVLALIYYFEKTFTIRERRNNAININCNDNI